MAQILVRDLKESTVRRLKKRAKQERKSLQAEVKRILEEAAESPRLDVEAARKICRDFRRRFKGRKFPDTVSLIREDRNR